MPLRTILVCLNETNRLAALCDAAEAIAARDGAHVRGLYVVPAAQIYPSTGFEAVPQVFEGHQTFFRKALEATRTQFESRMAAQGLSAEFFPIDGRSPLISDEIISHGKTADLIVLGAPATSDVSGVEVDCAERVLIGAGRPVLILPRDGGSGLALSTAVIGWDGGREAVRAVFDGLPLLSAAQSVHIVCVDPAQEPHVTKEDPGRRLVAALSRHGIAAQSRAIRSGPGSAGRALLAYAREQNAGFLVMGAYSHSRLREFVFGGATKSMLAELDRPVLMSH
jgi:nucleotide-binding universal stress UspA family protein